MENKKMTNKKNENAIVEESNCITLYYIMKTYTIKT